jgi:hypothetical protein
MLGRPRFALETKSRCGGASIGEKLEMSSSHLSTLTANILKSLALPRGDCGACQRTPQNLNNYAVLPV